MYYYLYVRLKLIMCYVRRLNFQMNLCSLFLFICYCGHKIHSFVRIFPSFFSNFCFGVILLFFCTLNPILPKWLNLKVTDVGATIMIWKILKMETYTFCCLDLESKVRRKKIKKWLMFLWKDKIARSLRYGLSVPVLKCYLFCWLFIMNVGDELEEVRFDVL